MAADIDQNRSCQLWDVGGGHYYAAISVAPDGSEDAWLVDGDPDTPSQCTPGWDETPEHEELGMLPPAVRGRIYRGIGRCCQPTASGRRCLNRVAKTGDPCRLHVEVRDGG